MILRGRPIILVEILRSILGGASSSIVSASYSYVGGKTSIIAHGGVDPPLLRIYYPLLIIFYMIQIQKKKRNVNKQYTRFLVMKNKRKKKRDGYIVLLRFF